jgi:hypothetical protein
VIDGIDYVDFGDEIAGDGYTSLKPQIPQQPKKSLNQKL